MSDARSTSVPESADYPARLDVEYPDGGLNRVTTLFRIILVIPIGIVAGLLTNSVAGSSPGDANWPMFLVGITLFGPTLLMILFRQKYPRWWFDWNLEVARFTTRINAYLFLLRDDYPSTDERQAVTVDIDYPDAQNDLNRVLPLVKWFLAIPHYIVLSVLGIAGVVVVVLGWFAVLFTGTLPMWMFRFLEGMMRWGLRVTAYAFLLTTDRYPPFRLGE